MLVNSIPVDVVGDAYHIAANYLGKSGLIPATLEVQQPLLDNIVQEFRADTHNERTHTTRSNWPIVLSRVSRNSTTCWN